VAATIALLLAPLAGPAHAASGSAPVTEAPAGGAGSGLPIMAAAARLLVSVHTKGLKPRATIGLQLGSPASSHLSKRVFGFVNAGSLTDPDVGYRTWDYGLLSTVAFFGLTVDPKTGHFNQDNGWNVWHSSAASDLIATAHSHGVQVVLTVIYQDNGAGMCEALGNGAVTAADTAANLMGADGVNIDYEGKLQQCPDGQPVAQKLVGFTGRVRAGNPGYLSIDTYATAPEGVNGTEGGGFFDIPALAPLVDTIFAMDYSMESDNGPCPTCMGPTAPLTRGIHAYYPYNVTRSAADYLPWASKTILGFPYYGVKGCTAVNAGPNASVTSLYGSDPYTSIATYPTNPALQHWRELRDPEDVLGSEPYATFFSTTVNCWREEYWDDAASLGRKYDLVDAAGFQGSGIWALDYGGGSPDLWQALRVHYTGA
jgi:hypothetical protein